MNSAKEFLAASTIHGLCYIEEAKSPLAKMFWGITIITSLSLAGIFINNSIKEWAVSPIKSTISTHPIEDLKFPNVTVCPPNGTNTALNYDLVRLNNTFSPSEVAHLKKEIDNIFFVKENREYIDNLHKILDVTSLKRIYNGFQSIPTLSLIHI